MQIGWSLEMKGVTGGTHLSITSCSLNMSSGLASNDLIQETLDEYEKLKGKIKLLESKLKKEREFHSTMYGNYVDETVWDMVETKYRMHLYQYKQKIWQCKILLPHTNFENNSSLFD